MSKQQTLFAGIFLGALSAVALIVYLTRGGKPGVSGAHSDELVVNAANGKKDSPMYIGEALVIDGTDLDNVAHIDVLIGSKDGPVGAAFANALARQSAGHINLLAVVAPNLLCKPATVMITKVTLKESKQILQMFGPAQAAVARAVVDSVTDGVIPHSEADNLVIVCGVFIAGGADNNAKIYKNNYEATKLAIKRAIANEPKMDEIRSREIKNPYE